MMKPLLSICIPTYNRAHYLKDALESIVAQFNESDIAEQVEIVVSDNASVDETETVVKSFQNRFGNIRYFKNEANIGFDRNVRNVISNAAGLYCWTLGDDDVICGGGLRIVLDYLAGNKVAVLTVKSRNFADIADIAGEKIKDDSDPAYQTASFDDFLWNGYCPGILSVLIFQKDSWLKNAQKDVEIDGWLYYGSILKLMSKAGSSFAHIGQPLVCVRQDCAWNKNGREFIYYMSWRRLLHLLPSFGYDSKRVRLENTKVDNHLPIILLRAKANDLKMSQEHLRDIWQGFYKRPAILIIAAAIFIIPNPIIKMIKRLKKSL